jgi:hypothetical protein
MEYRIVVQQLAHCCRSNSTSSYFIPNPIHTSEVSSVCIEREIGPEPNWNNPTTSNKMKITHTAPCKAFNPALVLC